MPAPTLTRPAPTLPVLPEGYERAPLAGPLRFEQVGDEPRSFRAVFATFGERTDYGDIWEREAVEVGAEVIVGPFNHAMLGFGGVALPVGTGVLEATATEAIIAGRFLDTTSGLDHYETVRQLPGIEWSSIYRILDSRSETVDGEDIRHITSAEVYSVDPVLLGANVNTRTLEVNAAPPAALPTPAAATIQETAALTRARCQAQMVGFHRTRREYQDALRTRPRR